MELHKCCGHGDPLNIPDALKTKCKGYDSILDEPRRILNGDKTCFLLGPKETKVLAPKGCKNVYEVDKAVANANLTVMFTFSASGDTTPPMIIYPCNLNSVPEEWGVGLSENGWMKAEIFFEYITLYANATRIIQLADVGVFKPVKALWRRAVLQCLRGEYPNEQLTKEKFAPILRIVVDSIKPSIIVNGFKTTGLYPFTFDGIDASKCL
ncbi:hypothetical protein QE152_g24406 [Popillia japonica]|uniref:DDE-1 domain-containing protein n=1 Tax=Popillia japonica TaxID=7064 RepID=A0AAW1KF66_POPJA